MSTQTWTWSNSAQVKAYLNAAFLDGRNLRMDLPAPAGLPMVAVASWRVIHAVSRADESFVDTMQVQGLVLKSMEQLLLNYVGVDLDRTLLMDSIRLPVPAESAVPTVVVWDHGRFGVFDPSEIDLGEDFFTERILLLTELRCSTAS